MARTWSVVRAWLADTIHNQLVQAKAIRKTLARDGRWNFMGSTTTWKDQANLGINPFSASTRSG